MTQEAAAVADLQALVTNVRVEPAMGVYEANKLNAVFADEAQTTWITKISIHFRNF
jgi:hypothetical protein